LKSSSTLAISLKPHRERAKMTEATQGGIAPFPELTFLVTIKGKNGTI
jgi:hypothetical protein